MRRLFGETRKVERRGEKRSTGDDEESEMGDAKMCLHSQFFHSNFQ